MKVSINMKKVAVLNFSGNVGKSTIARHVIKPLLPEDALLLSIETVNSDLGLGEDALVLKGTDVEQVQEEVLLNETLVVDVGASNIEPFLKGMALFSGSIDDFDGFVIPVTPDSKQQIDTVTTVDYLIGMGVPTSKIRVIFNRVTADMDVSVVFDALIEVMKEQRVKTSLFYISDNSFFEKADEQKLSLNEILNDTTDYIAAIKAEEDRAVKRKLTERVLLQRLAVGIDKQLSDLAKDLL